MLENSYMDSITLSNTMWGFIIKQWAEGKRCEIPSSPRPFTYVGVIKLNITKESKAITSRNTVWLVQLSFYIVLFIVLSRSTNFNFKKFFFKVLCITKPKWWLCSVHSRYFTTVVGRFAPITYTCSIAAKAEQVDYMPIARWVITNKPAGQYAIQHFVVWSIEVWLTSRDTL